jgi:hypothetical protein
MAVLLSWLGWHRPLSPLYEVQIGSIPALLSVGARSRPTAQAPWGWLANWHVVLLDDVETLDHREEHTQEGPASEHAVKGGSEASSRIRRFAGSSRN